MNQLFRSSMPYMLKLHNKSFFVYNKNDQELFSCEMRRTRKRIDFLKSLARGAFYDDENGVRSYLYKSEPSLDSAEYNEYMSRLHDLLSFLDQRIWSTELQLEKNKIQELKSKIANNM